MPPLLVLPPPPPPPAYLDDVEAAKTANSAAEAAAEGKEGGEEGVAGSLPARLLPLFQWDASLVARVVFLQGAGRDGGVGAATIGPCANRISTASAIVWRPASNVLRKFTLPTEVRRAPLSSSMGSLLLSLKCPT